MAGQIPEDFMCPISLEIMSDPVILSSGHTFDRSSIQRWLDAGHRSCPITKLPLSSSPNLIPNHALRSLISNFTPQKPQQPHYYPSNPNPQSLISSLISPSSSVISKLNSLDQLTRLSKRDSSLRRRLTESGAASAVLDCISSNDAVLREKALNLLLNLSLDDDNKVGLVAEGAIDTIISVLRGGGSCRAVAATILTSLAVVDVNKATIGAYPFAISGLISMLGEGNGREKKEAATALFTVCSFVDNRRRAVECGAVPVLVSAAELGIERAVEVLGLLAKCKEGREEMGRFSECVRVLVNVIKDGSGRGVLYALITMNSLCCYSEGMCVEAIREGVFDVCLGLLEDDNEKVRRNAASLVQILRGERGGGGR